MPVYSKKSKEKLEDVDPRLVQIFERVLEIFDHSIWTGRRSEEEQNKAFKKGASTKTYPHSRHNSNPSEAIDANPYPSDLGDLQGHPRTEIELLLGKCLEILARLEERVDTLADTEDVKLARGILEKIAETDLDRFESFHHARERLSLFAGFVMMTGELTGNPIRWGGCWAGGPNFKIAENKFDDLFHFELKRR